MGKTLLFGLKLPAVLSYSNPSLKSGVIRNKALDCWALDQVSRTTIIININTLNAAASVPADSGNGLKESLARTPTKADYGHLQQQDKITNGIK